MGWKLMIPALLSTLFLLQAVPLAQAYSGVYYVKPSSLSLRECPANSCAPLLTVYQGEKAEILERTSTGWTRVKLVERPAIGWIPSDFVRYSPDLQDKPVPPYHVKISSRPPGQAQSERQRRRHLALQRPGGNVGSQQRLGPGARPADQRGRLGRPPISLRCVGVSSQIDASPPAQCRKPEPQEEKPAPKEEQPAPAETPKLPSPM